MRERDRFDEVHIMCGLPGSGKTRLAKELHSAMGSSRIVDFDEYRNKESFMRYITPRFTYSDHIVILDGLFLTNESYKKVIEEVPSNKYVFHWFEIDREACLYNDRFRREKNSTITIKNAAFEQPNIEMLQSLTKATVLDIRMYVIRKSREQLLADKFQVTLQDDNTIHGDNWSLGGSCCDCWGGTGYVDPDPQPLSCSTFDEILEKLCPNTTFLQYKKLFNSSVTTDTKGYSDYYGGSTTDAFYVIKVTELIEGLDELGCKGWEEED